MIDVAETTQQQTKPELPEGWRWARLGDICDVVTGGTPSRGESRFYGGTIPWIKPDDLDKTLYVDSSTEYLSEVGAKEVRVLPAGSVLVSCIGKLGKSAIAARSLATNQQINALIPKPTVDSLYLYYACKCLQPALQAAASVTIVPIVNKSAFSALQIPLAPLAEQQRIATILAEQMAAVEQAQAAAEVQIAAAKELPAAYLRSVFESDEARGWETSSLGEIVQLKNGINFTSTQKGRGILTVDVLNMYSDTAYLAMKGLYRVDIQPKDDYILHPRDILFVRSSVKQEGVAWPALFSGYTEPVTFCGFLIRARLTTAAINPEFLIAYLRLPSVRRLLISKSGTGTITNINQGNLETLPVPIPSLATQQRVVEMFAQQRNPVEQTRKTLEDQLNTINQLPAALLRQAFSGEL